MNRHSILIKVCVLSIGSVVVTAGILLACVMWQKRSLETTITSQLHDAIKRQVSETSQTLYRMVEGADQQTSRRLAHNLTVLQQDLAQAGQLAFSDPVEWTAINQVTKQATRVTLPKMTIGEAWLGQNDDPNVETPFVDNVRRYTRDVCTIFQRMNDQGDMLRVATGVLDAKGRRAIGTYIPAKNADGTPNPVLAEVLQGKPYQGVAKVVDRLNATRYEPLWDSSKSKVVGMIFTGVDFEGVTQDLRASIARTRVGSTGYAFVLGGKGDLRGVYRVSKDGKRDGENLWETRDADGKPVIQEMITESISLRPGDVAFARYPWKEEAEDAPRMKVSAVTYYAPWDWVIGTGTHEDDYDAILAQSLSVVDAMSRNAAICAAVILIGLGGLSIIMARALTRPITNAVSMLDRIAQGHIAIQVPASMLTRQDELGKLARAIAGMTQNLRDMVGGLSADSKRLTNATLEFTATGTQLASGAAQTTAQSAQVAAAAEQLTTNMTGMAASTEQMSASVQMVASALSELTASISEVSRSAEQAAGVANNAAEMVAESNATIGDLGVAANGIGKVLESIQDIAEQTHLLALNATIEAARAGDAGRGFAVVATEVKELAKQTSLATEDIRVRIESIQGSAASAVESVGNISGIVQQVNSLSQLIASAVEEQSTATKEIARNVDESSHAADTVARCVSESAAASQEITRSISTVDQAAKDTAAGARRTQLAADDTWKIVENISTQMSVFKCAERGFDSSAVRTAHIQWVKRLTQVLSGALVMTPDQVSNDAGCAFGKWYHSEGERLYGRLPEFRALAKTHATVHATARQIVELCCQDDQAAAARLLAELAPVVQQLLAQLDLFEEASRKVPSLAGTPA